MNTAEHLAAKTEFLSHEFVKSENTVLDKKTVIIKSTNNAGTIYYLITDAPC